MNRNDRVLIGNVELPLSEQKSSRVLGFVILWILAWCSVSPALLQAQFSDVDLEFFESKIRPIFVEHCNQCHSADADFLEAGLDVTSRATLLEGGDSGPAVLPHQTNESLLIQAITYEGPYEMPPNSKLSDDKISLLKDWVNRGAPWPAEDDHEKTVNQVFDLKQRKSEHWSWQPIIKPSLPNVVDSDWPTEPLDHFVLTKLEKNGLVPGEECDRRTWIRRVYFDVIGMPPSKMEVETFLIDDSPKAYEKVIDGLLASPHFGERWARHWMDLFRFSETYGHEFDYPIAHSFQYRDYLIRAFNQDVPYDDFIIEHVAGDLVSNPRRNPKTKFNESIIGTGFWFLGEATHGPVDVKADEAGRIDNQIDVLCKSFLGLTVACARCHDHKFDAISAEDYYALSGFLQSSRRQIALLDPDRAIAECRREAIEIADSANQHIVDYQSEFREIRPEQWLAALRQCFDALEEQSANTNPLEFRFDRIAELKAVEKETHPFHTLYWILKKIPLLNLKTKKFDLHWAQQQDQYSAFIEKSELFEDFSNGIPEDWFVTGEAFQSPTRELYFSATGNFVEHRGRITSGRHGEKFQGVLRSPTFEITHDKIALRLRGRSTQARLIIDGYEMDVHNPLLFDGCKIDVVQNQRFEWVLMQPDVKNYKGHRAYLEFIDHSDGYIQIDEIRFLNDGDPKPVEASSHLSRLVVDAKPTNRDELLQALADGLHEFMSVNVDSPEYLRVTALLAMNSKSAKKMKQFREKIKAINSSTPTPTKVIAMTDGTPEDEHLFIRGNASMPAHVVPRRFLTAISDRQQDPVLFQHGSGRLDLAKQIASKENPLTSRVAVNRIWRQLLGVGIVKSVDNFGVLGEEPSHPGLLDFLAGEFSENGWSVKNLIRMIALSKTYRMSSHVNERAREIDPENRLLHRAHVARLEGEAIRDAILKISGTLDRRMFGPSVEVHLTEFMQGRGRPRKGGPLDGNGRRSVYLKIRRNFLSPMMLAFDTPIPFNAIGNRHQSNVPAQALILMNDPFVLSQAEKWAEKLLAEYASPRERLEHAFTSALGRPPTDDESNRLLNFVDLQGQELKLAPAEAVNSPLIWRDICHVVFNMKEMIYIK